MKHQESIEALIDQRTEEAIKLIILEARKARKKITSVEPTYNQRKEKLNTWKQNCLLRNECCSNNQGAEDQRKCTEEKQENQEKQEKTGYDVELREVVVESRMLSEVSSKEFREYTKREMMHLLDVAKFNLKELEDDLIKGK